MSQLIPMIPPATLPRRNTGVSVGYLCLIPLNRHRRFPPEPELEPFRYDSLSDSTPRRRTGFRRPRIQWANVASWNTDQNTEAHIYQEIARIMAVSMSDAQVEVTPKHNEKAISHFRLKMVCTRRNISILLIGICRTTSHGMGLAAIRFMFAYSIIAEDVVSGSVF